MVVARIAVVLVYLASAALAIVVVDAHTENGQLEAGVMVLWGLASVLLGWLTRQPLWAMLVLAVIALSVPFGSQNPPVYHEAAIMLVLAAIYGIGSAALIVISALARMLFDQLRDPAVAIGRGARRSS